MNFKVSRQTLFKATVAPSCHTLLDSARNRYDFIVTTRYYGLGLELGLRRVVGLMPALESVGIAE